MGVAIFSAPSIRMTKQAPKLKYASKIANYDQCPPADCIECDCVAFRWVFDPMTNECFWPLAKIRPDDDRGNCCEGWGLSFFTSSEKAIEKFTALTKIHKNLHKKLGTHLAEGKLDSSHGLATPVNAKSGHFTVFELKGVKLKEDFSVVKSLI